MTDIAHKDGTEFARIASRMIPLLNRVQDEITKSFESSKSTIGLNWVPLMEEHQDIYRICLREASNYMLSIKQTSLDYTIRMIFGQMAQQTNIVLKAFLHVFNKLSDKLKMMRGIIDDGTQITPEFIVKFLGQHCNIGEDDLDTNHNWIEGILKEERRDDDLPGIDPNDPNSYVTRHLKLVQRMNDSSDRTIRLMNEFLLSKRKIHMKSSDVVYKLKSLQDRLNSMRFDERLYRNDIGANELVDPKEDSNHYKNIKSIQDELMQKTITALNDVKRNRMQDASTGPDPRIFDINYYMAYKERFRELEQEYRKLLDQKKESAVEMARIVEEHTIVKRNQQNRISVLEQKIEEKQNELVSFKGELSQAGGEAAQRFKEYAELKKEVEKIDELKQEVKVLKKETEILTVTNTKNVREIHAKNEQLDSQLKTMKILTEEIKVLKHENHQIKLIAGIKPGMASYVDPVLAKHVEEFTHKNSNAEEFSKACQTELVFKAENFTNVSPTLKNRTNQRNSTVQQQQASSPTSPQQQPVQARSRKSTIINPQDLASFRSKSNILDGNDSNSNAGGNKQPLARQRSSILLARQSSNDGNKSFGDTVREYAQSQNNENLNSKSETTSPVSRRFDSRRSTEIVNVTDNKRLNRRSSSLGYMLDSSKLTTIKQESELNEDTSRKLPPLKSRDNSLEKEKNLRNNSLKEESLEKIKSLQKQMDSIAELRDDLSRTDRLSSSRRPSDLTIVKDTRDAGCQVALLEDPLNVKFHLNDRPISAISHREKNADKQDTEFKMPTNYTHERAKAADFRGGPDNLSDIDQTHLLRSKDQTTAISRNVSVMHENDDNLRGSTQLKNQTNYNNPFSADTSPRNTQGPTPNSTFHILGNMQKMDQSFLRTRNDRFSTPQREFEESTFYEDSDQAMNHLKKYLYLRKITPPKEEKLIWIFEFIVMNFTHEKIGDLMETLKVVKARGSLNFQELYAKLLGLPKGGAHYQLNPISKGTEQGGMVVKPLAKEVERKDNKKGIEASELTIDAGKDNGLAIKGKDEGKGSRSKGKRNPLENVLLSEVAKVNLLARYGFSNDTTADGGSTERMFGGNDTSHIKEKHSIHTKNEDYIQRLYEHITQNVALREHFEEIVRNALAHAGRKKKEDAELYSEETLRKALENAEEFKRFYRRLMNDHLRCGANCPHLKKFYEKVKFDIQQAKKGLYSVPVSIIKEPVFSEKDMVTKAFLKKELGD